MVDYRVRFVGDLGNLASFNSSIRNALLSNTRILEQANRGVVSRALGETVRAQGAAGPGLFIRNATTELDTYNNAIVQSGQVYRKFIQDYEIQTQRLNDGRIVRRAVPIFGEAYHSDFRKAIANLGEYTRAGEALAPVDRAINRIQARGIIRQARIETAAVNIGALVSQNDPTRLAISPAGIRAQQDQINKYLQQAGVVGRLDSSILFNEVGQPLQTSRLAKQKLVLATQVQDILRELEVQGKNLSTGVKAQLAAIENDPAVRALRQQGLYSALNPEGYIGTSGARLLENQQARNDLIKKAGLGQIAGQAPVPYQLKGGIINPEFLRNAEAQGFAVNDVVRDMERNLTRFSGTIRGTDGIMSQWTYTIDKNGNAVNTWGRSLSGARGFLNQTTRDLAKVVEWTVATTLVFGALGAAFASVSSINELNVNLQRFAITARASKEDLDGLFAGLSQVAYDTATPIREMVQAADDMALATRRANQSTEEWHANILELANAVGILTNISGIDTVQATELLVASMKQLNLNTSDLVPLLSQITAAAGGQSNSITDISTALAQLAESAGEAGLSLTQQIASIQVISQVTGKSADQTATAFKNLFGAVQSTGSTKKLAEFGIEVRKANGDLRPFLEIYKEIQDAIDTGIIPAGRIAEVVRAIAGGPRRAPDASALLSNINKVFEVEAIAANASNEALIANAKILDTNQAKITQFQNVIDVSVFEKFNEVIANLTSALVDLGTLLASLFSLIPTQAVTAGVQILLLAGTFKLLGRAMGALGLTNFFSSFQKGLGLVRTEARATAAAVQTIPGIGTFTTGQLGAIVNQRAATGLGPVPNLTTNSAGRLIYAPGSGQTGYASAVDAAAYRSALTPQVPNLTQNTRGQYIHAAGSGRTGFASKEDIELFKAFKQPITVDPSTRGLLQNFISKFNTKGGRLAGGAAVGAGLAGAGFGDIAGLAGTALLFNPATFLAGAGILAATTVIDLYNQEQEETKQKSLELQSTLYDLTQEWKQNQAGVDAARDTIITIKDEIANTEEGTQKYIDLQRRLGEVTVQASGAIGTQTATLEKMGTVLEQLDKFSNMEGPDWSTFLTNVRNNTLDKNTIDSLTGLLSQHILEATGQLPVSPNTPLNYDVNALSLRTSSDPVLLRYLTGSAAGPKQAPQEFTPEEILLNPETVREILRAAEIGGYENNPRLDFPFDNPAAVNAFRAGLAGLKDELGTDQYRAAVERFEQAVNQFGTASVVAGQSLSGVGAKIQAGELLGTLYGEDRDNASLRYQAALQLQEVLNRQQPPPSGSPDERDSVQAFEEQQRAILELIRSLTLNNQGGLQTGEISVDQARQVAINALQNQPSIEGYGSAWDDVKGNVDAADAAIANFWLTLTQGRDLIPGITDLVNSVFDAVSDRVKEANGETRDWANEMRQNIGQELLQLQAQQQGGEFDENPALGAALQNQLEQTLRSINRVTQATREFNQVTGGEGKQAAQLMLGSLRSLGINGFQGVQANIESLNSAFFGWINTLNLSDRQMIKVVTRWIQVMQLAAQAIQLFKMAASAPTINVGGTNFNLGPVFGGIAGGFQAGMAKLLKQIQNIGGGGAGTAPLIGGGSSGGGGGTPRSVDTIYLTEEQREVADPQALVKEAYKKALELQSQIPGEEKRNRKNTVIVFDEFNRIFKARGVSEELLRRALDELTDEVRKQNEKADVVRRIRVGAGDFSAIANVPVNSQTGVSIAGNNQINVTFNLNGTNLTPAQFEKFANMIGAEIARRL